MNGAEYAADHVCEWPDCTNLSPTSRTCSSCCRSRLWKAENHYRDARGVRNASRRRRKAHGTRYVIVRSTGPHLDILAFDTARSKRAAEAAFGIRGRADLFAIAAGHLPAVA